MSSTPDHPGGTIHSAEQPVSLREDSTNSMNLLAGLEEFIESTAAAMSEVFKMSYRGSSEIDRHYTKPMLPWIIAEIKNQNKFEKVSVEVNHGVINVLTAKDKVLFSHSVKQIHKCVMEQIDHTHFLYTLKPINVEKEPGGAIDSNAYKFRPPNNDHHCHLFKAESEEHVRSFFHCLRQQPRDPASHRPNASTFSGHALPDLSLHNDSQFYEVLFVGRVKVSHSKVPSTFIDEACEAFSNKRKNKTESNKSNVSAYQMSGSGFSVPNINLSDYSVGNNSSILWSGRSRSNSKEFGKGLVNFNETDELSVESKSQEVPAKLKTDDGDGKEKDVVDGKGIEATAEGEDLEASRDTSQKPPLFSTLSLDASTVSDGSDEPFRQRLNTISGGTSPVKLKRPSVTEQYRNRAGSIGSISGRARLCKQMSESQLKTSMSSEFNRTMLFHIGKEEIQLINSELKTIQLHKNFKDVPQRCQGIRYSDHFGFICRELYEDVPVYVGYVFRCDSKEVTKEIVQSLTKAFEVVQNAHQKEKIENSTCETCPMRWFSSLCFELEGLPAVKAHSVILKRVGQLPEEDRELLLAKYEGADAPELTRKNNVLMMLLRAHMEAQQMTHIHSKGPESSLDKVKKSLTSSFQHFLKREPGVVEESGSESATTTPAKVRMESVSESPLQRQQRPRSSTLTSMGGDRMRREFKARRDGVLQPSNCGGRQGGDCIIPAAQPPNCSKDPPHPMPNEVETEVISGVSPLEQDEEGKENTEPKGNRPKLDIFLKVGSPAGKSSSEGPIDSLAPPSPSFRHTILQRVITPSKEKTEGNIMNTAPVCRKWQELRLVWRKAIFRQMLLNKMEREVRERKALAEELEVQRVCLSYPEEALSDDTIDTWQMVLSRPNVRIDYNILKAGVRNGIPKEMRGDVWQLLATQQPNIHHINLPPSYHTPYEDMIKGLTSQQHAILIDLGRTFPQHPYFTRTLGPGQLGLFNLLKAYSRLDGEVGYCQGLSFVAGILLMHVDEERAYNLLKHVMFIAGIRRQFRQDLDGLQVQMYQLSRLLHDRLNAVYSHLEECDISPQLYAAPWFLTLFASAFPLHYVVRLYDMLFLFGLEAVFRISLVLLREHQDNIILCSGFEETMGYLKNNLPDIKVENLDRIIEMAFDEDITRELAAYEVEYQVLREELSVTPPKHQADLKKLTEEKKNLKRQNLDLVEQLQNTQAHKHALEASNQMLLQSQHHLEVRVRYLEVERANLYNVITLLWKAGLESNPQLGSALPSGLLRYLPSHEKSPLRARLKSESALSTNLSSIRSLDNEDDEDNHHVTAAGLLGVMNRQNAPSSSQTFSNRPPKPEAVNEQRKSSDIGLFGSKIDHSSPFPSFNIFSSSRDSNADVNKPVQRARSSTLDHGSMQRFVRGLTRNT